MSTVLPDPDTEFGARVARRLRDETIAWLTLVDGAGTPQPAPIWFLWDGESALIYSDHRAKRLDHLRANPRVALHLDGNGGGDIVVLTGEIAEDPGTPAGPDNSAYMAKYGDQVVGGPWGGAEGFAKTYSVPLRFRPRRVRGF